MFEPWWQRLPLLMSDNPSGGGGGGGGGGDGGDGGDNTNDNTNDTGNDTQPADTGNDTQPADGDKEKSPADKLTELTGDDEDGTDKDDDGETPPLELKTPEGFEADQERVTAFTDRATELGLTQEQAQGVLDYYAEVVKTNVDTEASAFTDRVNGWQKDLEADKEIGGDKLDENLATAALTLKAFGSTELIALLNPPSEENPQGLGLGNHPAVVRFFHAIGTKLADDTLVKAGRDKLEPEPLGLEGALYGRQAQQSTQ